MTSNLVPMFCVLSWSLETFCGSLFRGWKIVNCLFRPNIEHEHIWDTAGRQQAGRWSRFNLKFQSKLSSARPSLIQFNNNSGVGVRIGSRGDLNVESFPHPHPSDLISNFYQDRWHPIQQFASQILDTFNEHIVIPAWRHTWRCRSWRRRRWWWWATAPWWRSPWCRRWCPPPVITSPLLHSAHSGDQCRSE